jgi:glycosyltransferase involved in cell wall biosynthesis
MDRVERSQLAPGIITRRVIPNGIDLAIFQPGDRQAARTALGIPLDARVLVFAAAGIRNNPFKDFATLELALERLAFRTVQPILVLAIGETGQPQRWGNIERRLVGYVSCPKQMAQFYRSADLYVHAARAETAPLAIIEALACGTPVVASSVCGISELVRGLDAAGEGFSKAEATGMLVPAEDPEGLSATIEFLLTDDRLLASLGGNAARDAATRFDLKKMFEAYLDWYSEILEAERSRPASHALAEMDPRAAK